MSTLVLHGERAGGRAVGSPTTLDMRRANPIEVARQARSLLLSGAWRTAPKTGSDQDKAEYLLRVKLPVALALFPKPALHALTRRYAEPACQWDNLAYFAALALAPEPTPDDALLALLGQPCRRCAARLRDQLLASVVPPPRPAARRAVARPRPPARRRPLPGQQPPPPPYYRRRGAPWPPEMAQLRQRAARMHQQASLRRAASRGRP